jgi:hypothetical protein
MKKETDFKKSERGREKERDIAPNMRDLNTQHTHTHIYNNCILSFCLNETFFILFQPNFDPQNRQKRRIKRQVYSSFRHKFFVALPTHHTSNALVASRGGGTMLFPASLLPRR